MKVEEMMTNKNYCLSDVLTLLAVFAFPISCFTVRHGVHISLFLLVVLGIIQYLKASKSGMHYQFDKYDALILAAFSGLLLATLISQGARGAIHFAAFDGPSRLFIGGIVFLYLRRLNLPYMRVLEIAIPIGLIVLLVCVLANPGAYWETRFATYFVDFNTLGSQSFILALLCFLMLGSPIKTNFYINLLKLFACVAGLYISIRSGSRGGWLSGPFIFLLWIVLRFDDISGLNLDKKVRRYLELIAIISLIIILSIAAFYLIEPLSTRISHGYLEIKNWVTGDDLNGSAGIRLSMWKIALQLAGDHFWFGYGEIGMGDLLRGSYLDTPENKIAVHDISVAGPHNDIFSKLLSLGFIGLLAYFTLLLVPFVIFWKNRRSLNLAKRYASRIGLFYITGVFICGLANEQLSLKYLCSFYALMIATTLAQVLNISAHRDGQLS
jgi:O-antigen ligase